MAKVGWMLLVVKEDVTFDPVEVSLFGAVAVVAQSDQVSDLIK